MDSTQLTIVLSEAERTKVKMPIKFMNKFQGKQNYNSKVKTFYFLLVFLTFIFLLLTFNLSGVAAIDMESARYRIKYGNVNIGASSDQISSHYKLGTTIGQLAAGQFNSTGYVVKAGFQYWHAIVPFTFSVSNTNINFGTLVPNVFSTISDDTKTNLSVSFGSAGEYQVTTIEEGTLRTMTGNSIPDTICDGGTDTCTDALAKNWTSSSAYGFGYNMTLEDVPADFSGDKYRQFPDRTTDDSPAIVMTSANVTVDLTSKPKDIIHLSTVTFKANISPLQAAGSYQTVISFVATPGY